MLEKPPAESKYTHTYTHTLLKTAHIFSQKYVTESIPITEHLEILDYMI